MNYWWLSVPHVYVILIWGLGTDVWSVDQLLDSLIHKTFVDYLLWAKNYAKW